MSARRSIDEDKGTTHRRWQTPPPPTPCILHLPRPHRRPIKRSTNTGGGGGGGGLSFRQEAAAKAEAKGRGKLVALFGEEREFAGSVPMVVVHNAGPSPTPRRAKVKSTHDAERQHEAESGDWKFEAEVLRAECHVLRMEKEVAVQRWEDASRQMHHALSIALSLHSALQTLATGEGSNEIVQLQTTLENQIQALQSKSESESESSMRQTDCSNFDRQAVFLRRRLRKSPQYTLYSQPLQYKLQNLVQASDYSMESGDREENPEVSAEINIERSFPSFLGDQPTLLGDAALLKKRLDSLSMGMSESKAAAAQIREEYKHMLGRSGRAQGEELCCQRCKATIRKIAAQVQAETEQWSQVQDILHHVREEMDELHNSRDLWEDRAVKADAKIAALQAEMHEWREKAHTYSSNVTELQSEISGLRNEIVQAKERHGMEQSRWLCLHSPDSGSKSTLPRIRAAKLVPVSRSQRRVESLQPKETENVAPSTPLVDIGNTHFQQ